MPSRWPFSVSALISSYATPPDSAEIAVPDRPRSRGLLCWTASLLDGQEGNRWRRRSRPADRGVRAARARAARPHAGPPAAVLRAHLARRRDRVAACVPVPVAGERGEHRAARRAAPVACRTRPQLTRRRPLARGPAGGADGAGARPPRSPAGAPRPGADDPADRGPA